MSGQQHIRWFEIAQRAIGDNKLMDLTVITAPYGEQSHLNEVHEKLLAMSGRSRE